MADVGLAGTDAEVTERGDVDRCVDRFVALKHRVPKPEEQPTAEQLSVLAELLKSGTTDVDFSIWGPHGSRTLRGKYFEGLVLAASVP